MDLFISSWICHGMNTGTVWSVLLTMLLLVQHESCVCILHMCMLDSFCDHQLQRCTARVRLIAIELHQDFSYSVTGHLIVGRAGRAVCVCEAQGHSAPVELDNVLQSPS